MSKTPVKKNKQKNSSTRSKWALDQCHRRTNKTRYIGQYFYKLFLVSL